VALVDRLLVPGGTGFEIDAYERSVLIRLKALMLLGFWAGLDCQQLAAVKVVRTPLEKDALALSLGDEVLYCPRLVRLCPFRAIQDWMGETSAADGPLFHRIARRHSGGVYPVPRALHPAGICSMLDSVWRCVEGVTGQVWPAAVMRWTGHHGWCSVDRNRLLALAEFVGLDVSRRPV
jgi:hypothetical protein